jgi:hypothetical protein
MTRNQRQHEDSDKRDDANSGERKMEGENDIICRCKEVSKKTFPEMVKLMISDLAFWKKTKGQK